MKSFEKRDLYSDGRARRRPNFISVLLAIVNSVLAIYFVLISLRVLLAWPSSVLDHMDYQWPLIMKIFSITYIAVSVVLLMSQFFAFFGGSRGGRTLVACLAFFALVYFVELFSVFSALGFMAILSYEFIGLIFLISLMVVNYFVWWKRK